MLRLEFSLVSFWLLERGCSGWTAGPESRGHHRVEEMGAWGWESIRASCRGSALSQVRAWQVIVLSPRGSGLEGI